MLIDTHCHIHEQNYPLDISDTLQRARAVGVSEMICVGTSEQSSREAVLFAAQYDGVFAAIGVHPHEALIDSSWDRVDGMQQLLSGEPRSPSTTYQLPTTKLVAIGEIGLDYFYSHSPRDIQIAALEAQLQLAMDHELPVIFHVRDAFDDFWPIFDNFRGLRGELHSFTDTQKQLDEGLGRGLYVGVNGISTFTKDAAQQKLFASIPLERLLLETDAPFLTPVPFRGKVNEPAYVSNVAQYHAKVRNLPIEQIAAATTANAHALFAL